MRADPLVEVEQLVALRPGEPAARGRQLVQTRPLVLVGEHVGIQVHAVTVGAGSGPPRPRSPTYDDPVSSATVGVGDDDFVTGDAVALDLPPASIGSRMLSGFLDYTIVWVVTFTLVSAGAALSRQLDDALVAATLLVCFLVAWLGYPITMETLTRGRSLGKMATGLRTVRDDAGPITFRHALTRGLLGVVEVYLLWGVPADHLLPGQQEGQAAR